MVTPPARLTCMNARPRRSPSIWASWCRPSTLQALSLVGLCSGWTARDGGVLMARHHVSPRSAAYGPARMVMRPSYRRLANAQS